MMTFGTGRLQAELQPLSKEELLARYAQEAASLEVVSSQCVNQAPAGASYHQCAASNNRVHLNAISDMNDVWRELKTRGLPVPQKQENL